MVTSKFQGKFMYYENINGKEKKVAKEFSDPNKFNEFIKKYPALAGKPMSTLGSMFGLVAPDKLSGKPVKKALTIKKATKKPAKKKK